MYGSARCRVCLCQAVGVVLELKPDVTLVSLAIVLSIYFPGHVEGVREGSVVAALVTGYIVTFFSRHVISGANLRRMCRIVAKQV